VSLTYDQFRYAFADVVSEEEAKELYETCSVPGSGVPLVRAATANFNPCTEAKVETESPEREPLLIISGENDHTFPWAVANAKVRPRSSRSATGGHSLTIDSGWREVGEKGLEFVKRFV
jgi:hypothetical protein